MKRWSHNNQTDIFGMSNVLGKYIKVERNVPFSFYYSPMNSSHGPRVKLVFNSAKMRLSQAGTLKLCDDWEFVPGSTDDHVSQSDIRMMKEFFRKYLILFLLVWDEQMSDPLLGYYLEGREPLHNLIEDLDFYTEYQDGLDNIDTVEKLEEFCRSNNLVNFYGN